LLGQRSPKEILMKRRPVNSEDGFSLIEGVIVVAIIFIVGAMTVFGLGTVLRSAKANSAMNQLVSQLRSARERAIAHRCEVQVQFVGTNQVTVSEIWAAGSPPPPVTVSFEGGATFQVFNGIPDTPMVFGNSSPVYFAGQSGGPPVMKFTSTGAFIDAGNTFVDGTVFLGITGKPSTARAVTILGSTGRVRQYHWDGTQWQE
jgi:type II secretory pathway pseudopilin PulG